jgi:hypothetical protein
LDLAILFEKIAGKITRNYYGVWEAAKDLVHWNFGIYRFNGLYEVRPLGYLNLLSPLEPLYEDVSMNLTI